MKMCLAAMATGILTFVLFLALGMGTVSAPENIGADQQAQAQNAVAVSFYTQP